MNRMIKAVIAAAAAMTITAASAFAEQWINISSWSYDEVSAFVSAELLPESLEGTVDYRQPITRLQFCDLIESVIIKTKPLYDVNVRRKVFSDTDADSSASFLYNYGIVEGVSIEDKRKEQLGQIYAEQNMEVKKYFGPDMNITREDAAVIVYRAGKTFGSDIWYALDEGAEYDDMAEISDYAAEAVIVLRGIGMVTDMENNLFCHKAYITVEQAIAMAYRMYSSFSKVIAADYEYAASDGSENEIKRFENGLTETYDGKILRIKENAETLMGFEADVYSVVNCAGYGGKRLAFAVNFNDKTDVYDVDTGEFLYEIPYIVIKADGEKGLAYTVSSRWYPVLYGLYSMDGQELMKPEYSETELEELEQNGYSIPSESYREPDGILYYSDKADGGCLYKVDTNGENREKLSDISGWDISYYDNRLFFRSYDDSALHIINTDGTGYKSVSVRDEILLFPPVDKWGIDADGIWQPENNIYKTCGGMNERYAAQGYAFATDGFHSKLYSINMNGVEPQLKKLDEGIINDCLIGDGCIYYLRNTEDGLIRNDGISAEQLTPGYRIKNFGYACKDGGYDESRILFTVFDKDGMYEYDIETGNIRELNVNEAAEREDIDIYSQLSDESYSFRESGESISVFSVLDGDGNKTADISGILYKRSGNTIIYIASDREKTGKKGSKLISFELDTGYETVISEDFSRMIYAYERPDSIMYADARGMVYVYSRESGAKTVLPCGGLYKYGELLSIEEIMPENAVYKLDVNGRLCRLTDGGITDIIYVPNS